MSKYEVGQQVWVYDVNRTEGSLGRPPEPATVVKVGRRLVTVAISGSYQKTFRIENGVANDQYGHQWIRTDDERAARERHAELVAALRAHRVVLDFGCRLTVDDLERLVAALPRGDEEGE